MQLTLDLPDELSAILAPSGQNLPRAAFEAIALESYRERKLTTAQLRRLLGYQTRLEVDGFLKEHGVELEYTLEDLERDREAHRNQNVVGKVCAIDSDALIDQRTRSIRR